VWVPDGGRANAVMRDGAAALNQALTNKLVYVVSHRQDGLELP
jgi:hypothetical protein